MTTPQRFCTACGSRLVVQPARFCTECGAPLLADASAPPPVPPRPVPPPPLATMLDYSTPVTGSQDTSPHEAGRPRGWLNSTRLLSALCMFSGVLAITHYGAESTTGRTLIVASLLVAGIGQLLVFQAVRPQPRPWVLALLPAFWVGLVAVGVLWIRGLL